MSLELLGATRPTGISSKYITVRVVRIDVPKLQKAVGGTAGATIPLALSAANLAPDMVLKSALPFVESLAKDGYGVELETSVSDAGPAGAAKSSGGLFTGAALVGAAWALWHFAGKLL